MSKARIKRALISVYDKRGIIDFAAALASEFGVEIFSTGGTAALLEENHIPVKPVEEITGLTEMMDGRVKTLHPGIHAAILADRDNPQHMRQLEERGIDPIDMVVVNLYPFEKTVGDPNCAFEQAIEMIDIGGPCLLRAAAKNHKHVLVICDPESYAEVLTLLRDSSFEAHEFARFRMHCSARAFEVTTCYDGTIAKWMGKQKGMEDQPQFEMIPLKERDRLRYGENPHQQARLFLRIGASDRREGLADLGTVQDAGQQHPMSFNNYVDASAALELCKELTRELAPQPAAAEDVRDKRVEDKYSVVFVKHTNACGVGVAAEAVEAYRRAYLGDPNAAMGGVLACSFDITADFAATVMETFDQWGRKAGAGGFFVEVWIAPSFDEQALEVIKTSKEWGKRVRLLTVGDMDAMPDEDALAFRTIAGGVLVQTRDLIGLDENSWKIVTRRRPTDSEMADLRLAWLICKHTRSNAITICKDNMLLGNGAGQMSRVMSCRIATWLAGENGHERKLDGSVAASDAFFPFADGPKILMDAGVTAIIQPGGSKRDAETISACDERSVAMVFTGTRHFKH